MKRPLRWAFNLCAVVSAVLCAGLCVLWVRSYRAADGAFRYTGPEIWGATSNRGSLSVYHSRPKMALPLPPLQYYSLDAGPIRPSGDPGLRRDWHALGFRWMQSDGGTTSSGNATTTFWPAWEVGVPHALLAILLAVPPVLLLRRARRRKRLAPNLCAVCGYDLRATPEAGGALLDRCPECGAVPLHKTPDVCLPKAEKP